MSDSDIATDLMIRPSPEVKGAFRCGMCGNANLQVFCKYSSNVPLGEQKVIGIAIICTVCHNTMEFSNGDNSPR